MVQLFKTFIILSLFFSSLMAIELSPHDIKKLIGRTVILGFEGTQLTQTLKNDIDKYNLGGVILFNKDYETKKLKNIKDPKQLKTLITDIQNYSKYKIFISIDQEGGKVSRLNAKNGFEQILSAKEISKLNEKQARIQYQKLSSILYKEGINLNFAPVVDLAKNKENKVIVKLERAYSKDSNTVVKYASIFIDELEKNNINSVLKHFPGHGSSKSDSHKGFVDISDTWGKEELQPYKKLIEKNKAKFIMTAHVYNKNLDENYPATLSHNINTNILRKELKFKGLIISDDLQMKAISDHYTIRQRVKLAINSGVNILLFGNQLGKIDLKTIVDTIYDLIEKKEVSLSKIVESNRLIDDIIYKKQ